MFEPQPTPLFASFAFGASYPCGSDSQSIASHSSNTNGHGSCGSDDNSNHNHNHNNNTTTTSNRPTAGRPDFDYQGFAPRFVASSGGPILLTDPIFNPSSAPLNFTHSSARRAPLRQRQRSGSSSNKSSSNIVGCNIVNNKNSRNNSSSSKHNLSSGTMAGAIEGSDFEAQQAAASQYQPDLKGPLVGNKTSSHAITAEYAKADPIYVTKTRALPNTYSHFRPIIGDGNCGWRAIVFCYFETLQKLGNKEMVEQEIQRMITMSNFFPGTIGHDPWIFEDMRDATTELLSHIAANIHAAPFTDANSLVLEKLNDKEISDSIVYFFRLLASSWLQSYPDSYSGFIDEGMTVETYRGNILEPATTEIDHLGLTLLVDALLKPIGVAVEVVYLDLSEGSHVNTHVMQQLDNFNMPTNPGGPMVYLLYRPGHYDILYKDAISSSQEDIIQSSIEASKDLRVNRVASLPQTNLYDHSYGVDYSILANLPGMSMNFGSSSGLQAPFYSFSVDVPGAGYSMSPSAATDYSCSPITPVSAYPTTAPATNIIPSQSLGSAASSHAMVQQQSLSQSIPTSPSEIMQNLQSPIVHHQQSRHSSVSSSNHSPSAHSYQGMQNQHATSQMHHAIRRSRYEIEAQYEQPQPPPLQTTTFKNSHYNTAHFNNPDFQPEEWKPEDDER